MSSQLKTMCESLEFTRSGSENPEGHVIMAPLQKFGEVRSQLGGRQVALDKKREQLECPC